MRIRKIANIAFIAVVSIGLCCTIALAALSAAVPGFSISDTSQLEGTKSPTIEDVFSKSFVKKKFQKETEKFLSSRIPGHDGMLLLQSSAKRACIKAAAAPFGITATPAFFGTNKIEDAVHKVLTVSSKGIPKSTACQDEYNRILNDAARNHEDVRFAIDWILKDNFSELDPCYELKGGDGLVNEAWFYEHNVEPLDERLNAFVDSPYDTEIESPVFPSDSHWIMPRALESYNKVADILDLKKVDWDELETYEAVETWYGTRARAGLDLDYPNKTIDDTNEFSNLKFFKLSSDEPLSDGALGLRSKVLHGEASESELRSLLFSGYTNYYGGSGARIVNEGTNNGRNLLLVGDSYSHCLKRYFADNYAQTIVVLPGNEKVDSNLEELIAKYDIDDVVVMMHPLKADIIADKSPSFLSGVTPNEDADEGE